MSPTGLGSWGHWGGGPRVAPIHSQHEVLLPGGQVAPHCNGCALDILYLQCHVGVKLLYGSKKKVKWTPRDPPRQSPIATLPWGTHTLPSAPPSHPVGMDPTTGKGGLAAGTPSCPQHSHLAQGTPISVCVPSPCQMMPSDQRLSLGSPCHPLPFL